MRKLSTPPKGKKRRIALVANSSWYTYNFRLGLLRRLREEGFEVYVIAPKDHYSTRLIALGFHFIHLPLGIYNTNPLHELGVLRQLIRVYRTYRFDLIFHYTAKPNIYGTLAAAWCRIPSIAITTGLGLLRDPQNKTSRRALLALYQLAARFTRELWFLNEDDRRLFLERGIVRAEKTYLLPSEGVDIQWYRPARTGPPSSSRPLRFLYAGRIVKSKGVEEFYRAARYFREQGADIRFEIVGFIVPEHPDGISFERVQQWNRQGLIRFYGESDDIRPHLEAADCLVLPSYYEGVSRVLLEAASMARPIITSDTMGCREVVEDGVNGFLCRPGDARDLIRKMETFLLLSPAERAAMGLAGRRKVLQEFDEEIVIGHYLRAVKRQLGGRRKAGRVYSDRS